MPSIKQDKNSKGAAVDVSAAADEVRESQWLGKALRRQQVQSKLEEISNKRKAESAQKGKAGDLVDSEACPPPALSSSSPYCFQVSKGGSLTPTRLFQDEEIESDHEPEKMNKFSFDADDNIIDGIASGVCIIEWAHCSSSSRMRNAQQCAVYLRIGLGVDFTAQRRIYSRRRVALVNAGWKFRGMGGAVHKSDPRGILTSMESKIQKRRGAMGMDSAAADRDEDETGEDDQVELEPCAQVCA